MNTLPLVLALGAIAAAIQGKDLWIGPLMILATIAAMAQNWINSKILTIAMRKKLQ